MSLRKAHHLDKWEILKSMRKWYAKSPAPQMKDVNWVEVELHVSHRIHTGHGYFSHGYFIMVDVGKPWWAAEKFLIEEIIIQVYDTYEPVRLAVADLDSIAKEHGCRRIATGDTQVGLMDRWYREAGFVLLGKQFYKELSYGMGTETDWGAGPD